MERVKEKGRISEGGFYPKDKKDDGRWRGTKTARSHCRGSIALRSDSTARFHARTMCKQGDNVFKVRPVAGGGGETGRPARIYVQ